MYPVALHGVPRMMYIFGRERDPARNGRMKTLYYIAGLLMLLCSHVVRVVDQLGGALS